MSFKKFLRIHRQNKKAQASLEYFILFAVIGALTFISLSSFLPKVRQSSQDLFITAVGRILNP